MNNLKSNTLTKKISSWVDESYNSWRHKNKYLMLQGGSVIHVRLTAEWPIKSYRYNGLRLLKNQILLISSLPALSHAFINSSCYDPEK